jgi:hypothetical protein
MLKKTFVKKFKLQIVDVLTLTRILYVAFLIELHSLHIK